MKNLVLFLLFAAGCTATPLPQPTQPNGGALRRAAPPKTIEFEGQISINHNLNSQEWVFGVQVFGGISLENYPFVNNLNVSTDGVLWFIEIDMHNTSAVVDFPYMENIISQNQPVPYFTDNSCETIGEHERKISVITEDFIRLKITLEQEGYDCLSVNPFGKYVIPARWWLD